MDLSEFILSACECSDNSSSHAEGSERQSDFDFIDDADIESIIGGGQSNNRNKRQRIASSTESESLFECIEKISDFSEFDVIDRQSPLRSVNSSPDPPQYHVQEQRVVESSMGTLHVNKQQSVSNQCGGRKCRRHGYASNDSNGLLANNIQPSTSNQLGNNSSVISCNVSDENGFPSCSNGSSTGRNNTILNGEMFGDNVDKLAEYFKRGCNINELGSTNYRERILHEIYAKGCEDTFLGRIKKIMGTAYGGGIFIIASHSDHIHVIHDCSWSNRQCRCGRIRSLNNEFTRLRRKNETSRDYDKYWWYNLTVYLCSNGRRIEYMDLGGKVRIQLGKIRYLPMQRIAEDEQERLLEESNISNLFSDNEYCGSESNNAGQNNCQSTSSFHNKSGNRKGSKGEQIHKFIRDFPTAPLQLIYYTKTWRTSKFKYMNRNLPLMRTIMSHIQSEYSAMSFKELSDMTIDLVQNNPQRILYGQLNSNDVAP